MKERKGIMAHLHLIIDSQWISVEKCGKAIKWKIEEFGSDRNGCKIQLKIRYIQNIPFGQEWGKMCIISIIMQYEFSIDTLFKQEMNEAKYLEHTSIFFVQYSLSFSYPIQSHELRSGRIS